MIVFFSFFLITGLYFLIPAVITQIFNPNSELIILTRTPTTGANAEIEKKPTDSRNENKKMFEVIQSITHTLCYSHIK